MKPSLPPLERYESAKYIAVPFATIDSIQKRELALAARLEETISNMPQNSENAQWITEYIDELISSLRANSNSQQSESAELRGKK